MSAIENFGSYDFFYVMFWNAGAPGFLGTARASAVIGGGGASTALAKLGVAPQS